MRFLCYTSLLLLVSFFQGIAAYPVNYNHNGRSESNPTIWPSPQTTSNWRVFQEINQWSVHSNDNKMEHNNQRLQVLDIPQHKKNHVPKAYHDSIPGRRADGLSVYPTAQGMFYAIGDFDRVLVPVSVLMTMVWLAFLAGGLVAIVDYVWVRWGRDYSGYSSSVGNTEDEEGDISKVEEGGEVKLELDCAEEDELD